MKKTLSDFEDTLLWMACRYACGRHSIQSSVLPCDIIQNYYGIMDADQRSRLAKDVSRELEMSSRWGSEPPDNRWYKFVGAMDEELHIQVEDINDDVHTCFKVGETVYPLTAFINNPWREVFLPKEHIKNETIKKHEEH